MNAQPWTRPVVRVDPEGFHRDLLARGLTVLEVGRHPRDPDVVTVYLHEDAADWVGGRATRLISEVPEVAAVTETVSSPAVLLVRFHPRL